MGKSKGALVAVKTRRHEFPELLLLSFDNRLSLVVVARKGIKGLRTEHDLIRLSDY